MRNHFNKENIVIGVMSLCLGGSLVYSLLHDPNEAEKKLRTANVEACQRGVAKSLIFKSFADSAATARRNSAVASSAKDDVVSAQNDLATASKYEGYGNKYVALTPDNCAEQYPIP